MDLTLFYDKIRAEERDIGEEFPVVISKETGDGGKAGHPTEVPKKIAARLIVQGLARLADAAEAEKFRTDQSAAILKVAQQESMAKVHLTVMPTSQVELLKAAAESKG
jgi:hypothetical protein